MRQAGDVWRSLLPVALGVCMSVVAGCTERYESPLAPDAWVAREKVKSFFRGNTPEDVRVFILWDFDNFFTVHEDRQADFARAVRDDTWPVLGSTGFIGSTSYNVHAMVILYAPTDALVVWVDDFGFSLGHWRQSRFVNPSLAHLLGEKLEEAELLDGERGPFRRLLLLISAGHLPFGSTPPSGLTEAQLKLVEGMLGRKAPPNDEYGPAEPEEPEPANVVPDPSE